MKPLFAPDPAHRHFTAALAERHRRLKTVDDATGKKRKVIRITRGQWRAHTGKSKIAGPGQANLEVRRMHRRPQGQTGAQAQTSCATSERRRPLGGAATSSSRRQRQSVYRCCLSLSADNKKLEVADTSARAVRPHANTWTRLE